MSMTFGPQLTESMKWESVRFYRNNYLSQSDWTQLSDSSANKSAWASYRQALRDIPQNFSKPEDVTWPAQPE
jgi:hypothetical protein